jgi:hypothetical protein
MLNLFTLDEDRLSFPLGPVTKSGVEVDSAISLVFGDEDDGISGGEWGSESGQEGNENSRELHPDICCV